MCYIFSVFVCKLSDLFFYLTVRRNRVKLDLLAYVRFEEFYLKLVQVYGMAYCLPTNS